MKELSAVLHHAGIKLGEKEVKSVFRLLDRSGNGRIS
jgi:Ca2+-binding EF-hand superfamily protein